MDVAAIETHMLSLAHQVGYTGNLAELSDGTSRSNSRERAPGSDRDALRRVDVQSVHMYARYLRSRQCACVTAETTDEDCAVQVMPM
jgi:hypothetical protein